VRSSSRGERRQEIQARARQRAPSQAGMDLSRSMKRKN
jgi:hypothetical protein